MIFGRGVLPQADDTSSARQLDACSSASSARSSSVSRTSSPTHTAEDSSSRPSSVFRPRGLCPADATAAQKPSRPLLPRPQSIGSSVSIPRKASRLPQPSSAQRSLGDLIKSNQLQKDALEHKDKYHRPASNRSAGSSFANPTHASLNRSVSHIARETLSVVGGADNQCVLQTGVSASRKRSEEGS